MNIIITGASSGIGYELVKYFAQNNADNIIIISRNSDKLNTLKKECYLSCNTNIIPITANLNNEDSFNTIINALHINKIDSIDILINNAGTLEKAEFENTTLEQLKYIYSVNVFAPYILIQKLIPFLNNSKKAHVINIGSMGGFQGSVKFPGISAYSSSKAAIANITECLAEEYKNTRIHFNCLALGAVNTEMLQKAFPDYLAPINADEMARYIFKFALSGYELFNGKIIPISSSTP